MERTIITAVEARMVREVMKMKDPLKLHNLAEIVFNGVKDLEPGDDVNALTGLCSLAGFIEMRAVYLLLEKMHEESEKNK